ncbi:N-acetyltransferase [Chitinophaga polysaccharea]|uniref:N-acetyltransferase n=1 Tax=Chitinophaga TaxID=79328 RepID=UPI00145553FB|nr:MULTISPECIES: N-acetyltransferase [Chitinophaga]NLR59915.1 N-acetyltransferase [Chitinophaga polysaccharea]NLU96338.1 N-acetyltransferase [Chitinophaga sp. Ak27]
METDEEIVVRLATAIDVDFALPIVAEMEASAQARGTGIAKRDPAIIRKKILEGKAVIAFTADGVWAGFSYIQPWEEGRFVSNSGLIVAPAFRGLKVAAAIKRKIFELSRTMYPAAKIFSITTGLAVMKMNSRLGFEPVTYDQLPQEPLFWEGCKSCVNYPILVAKNYKNCLCTAMLFQPQEALA